ncbi:hypothetical protein TELCIR_01756, partial [Teladorsagia circumcincta]
SDIGRVMSKFRELEKQEQAAKEDDVYSASYVPKKFSKHSAEYGTPKPGTLTEMRAKKASEHVAKEMLYLCEIIRDYGYRSSDGQIQITFGKLFGVYQYISDKVVGMLLRARKHHMVDFKGEMLFQRQDDAVVITLLLSNEELLRSIEESPDSEGVLRRDGVWCRPSERGAVRSKEGAFPPEGFDASGDERSVRARFDDALGSADDRLRFAAVSGCVRVDDRDVPDDDDDKESASCRIPRRRWMLSDFAETRAK